MCREDLSAIYKRIANYLTERSIPTPRKLGAMRKEALGEPVIRQGKDEWAIASVQGILSNDFYIGTLRQGKYKRKGINGKDERIDDSKHLVFENHHEELRNYRKFASLTVTCEDAKAYIYSLSSKRRVHKWTDIQVNLYI